MFKVYIFKGGHAMKNSMILIISSLFLVLFSSPLFAQLADSPWPCYKHDASRTNQSQYTGPDNPELKWTFKEGDHDELVIGYDGILYFGGDYIYALNPDGTIKWKHDVDGNAYSITLGVDGTIYSITQDEDYFVNLYAVNSDGSFKWNVEMGRFFVNSRLAISKDGTIYASGTDEGLFAVNPDGTLKWQFNSLDFSFFSPAIGEDGTIYIVSDKHTESHLFTNDPDG